MEGRDGIDVEAPRGRSSIAVTVVTNGGRGIGCDGSSRCMGVAHHDSDVDDSDERAHLAQSTCTRGFPSLIVCPC